MVEPFGQRIRTIRKSKGLSMEEFGKLFNPPASKGVVSNWENNYNKPNNERLKKIAEIGNISIEELTYGRKQDYIRPIVIELANYYYDADIREDNKLINYIITNLSDYDYGTNDTELYLENKDFLDDIFMPGQWISESFIYWSGLELTRLSRHLEEIYSSVADNDMFDDSSMTDGIQNTVNEIQNIISSAHENVENLYTRFSERIQLENKKIDELHED